MPMTAMLTASPILAPLDMPLEFWEVLPVSAVCASDDGVEVGLAWPCAAEELEGVDVYVPVNEETQWYPGASILKRRPMTNWQARLLRNNRLPLVSTVRIRKRCMLERTTPVDNIHAKQREVRRVWARLPGTILHTNPKVPVCTDTSFVLDRTTQFCRNVCHVRQTNLLFDVSGLGSSIKIAMLRPYTTFWHVSDVVLRHDPKDVECSEQKEYLLAKHRVR